MKDNKVLKHYRYDPEEPRKVIDMADWGFTDCEINASETLAHNFRLVGEWVGNHVLGELYLKVCADGTMSLWYEDGPKIFTVKIPEVPENEDLEYDINFGEEIEKHHSDLERVKLP